MEQIVTDPDLRRGLVVLRLDGTVSRAARQGFSTAVRLGLNELPGNVIVDLCHGRFAGGLPSRTVARLGHAARRDPGVGLRWCLTAIEDLERLRTQGAGRSVFGSVDDAIADAGHQAWVSDRFPATPETPSLARLLIGDACLRWGLDHLLNPARLVVSELVNNAVEYAPGQIRVAATVRPAYLIITVRDSGGRPPVRPERPARRGIAIRGNGLRIVDELATSWGYRLVGDTGKTVWAKLATR